MWIGVLVVLAVAVTVVILVLSRTGTSTGVASSGQRIDPDPSIAIKNVNGLTADRESADPMLSGIFGDLNAFWSVELPKLFDTPLIPLAGGYQAIDSSAPDASSTGTLCAATPARMVGNAFYCPAADGIIVDVGALVPVLTGHYGLGGLVASLAHEFGHAIQARIGPTAADRAAHPADYPSVVIEAGGDCNAGAFLAWVASGDAPHIHIPAGDLLRSVAPLVDFRDPVTTSVTDPAAHGLGLDRLTALLIGYRSGPAACRALIAAKLSLTLGRAGTSTAEAPQRFTSDDAVFSAANSSVGLFLDKSLPGHVAVLTTPATAEMAAARPYGQFASAASVARSVGLATFGNADAASCFTGAWTASVFGAVPPDQLGGWAGDPDEALDYLRSRPGASFGEVAAYADGFHQGLGACRSNQPATTMSISPS